MKAEGRKEGIIVSCSVDHDDRSKASVARKGKRRGEEKEGLQRQGQGGKERQ